MQGWKWRDGLDTLYPHAMVSAAGVATGEMVPTSPGHVSTLSSQWQQEAGDITIVFTQCYTQANY